MAVTYSSPALEVKSPQYAYALVILCGGIAFSISQLGAPVAYWLCYALLAALFGSIWPQGTWQWGGWLCLPIIILIGFDLFVSGSSNGLLTNGLILAKALPSACLGAYLGSTLSPRKLATRLAHMQSGKKHSSSNGNGAQSQAVLKEPVIPPRRAQTSPPVINSQSPRQAIEPVHTPADGNNMALVKVTRATELEDFKPLETEAAAVDSQGGRPWTPLMVAALEGHVKMVETLFGKGAVMEASSDKGSNALMIATIEGHTEVVSALLDHGTEVNAENQRGWTALRFAVSMDETQILRLLIAAGADVNRADHEGKTALMQAAGENILESLKVLLEAGADPHLTDRQGKTALMIAQKQGHTEIVKLLKHAEAKNAIAHKASINLLDNDDDSYLYLLKEELEAELNSHPDTPLTDEIMERLVEAAKKQRALSPSEIAHKLMLTLQEAATLSGLPRQHLLEAIEEGTLKAQSLEHSWRIRRVELDDYIRRLA